MASEKRFFLDASQIVEITPGRGGCFASDLIMVKGHPVRFMYREASDFEGDTGWRFFGGTESQDYVDDASNIGIYALDTVANYDLSIIPFLDAPIGSAFEKLKGQRDFVAVLDFEAD